VRATIATRSVGRNDGFARTGLRFAARSGVVALLALALSACLQTTREASKLAPASMKAPDLSPGTAINREHERITAAYGGVFRDPGAEKTIARITGRLVAASDRPSQSYQITILNSPVVNAFALPGGYLYVTRGLLALANDTSEVAAVLSHEIAHVTARHASARRRRMKNQEFASRVVESIVDERSKAEALAISQRTFAKFTQQQEFEADRRGIRTLAKAGYDPYAAARFLTSMARFSGYKTARGNTHGGVDFLSSHPSTPARVREAVRIARASNAPGIGERDKGTFLNEIDGLVYGHDPSEGIVRGRTFLHKRLRIRFTVPPGFRVENTAKAVLATNGSGTAMRFDGTEFEAGTSMEDYLKSGWVNGLITSSVKKITHRGLDAAIGSAAADGWSFRLVAVRLRGSIYRFIFASRLPNAAFERAFNATWQSFRPITRAEANSLRPLSIRVVKAGSDLARTYGRMGGSERPRQLFETLNGLAPGEKVKPGTPVKVIR